MSDSEEVRKAEEALAREYARKVRRTGQHPAHHATCEACGREFVWKKVRQCPWCGGIAVGPKRTK